MPTPLDGLAVILTGALEVIYGKKKGFALLIFDLGKPGVADYLGNTDRDDILKAFAEASENLKKGEDIGPPVGSC